MEASGVLRSCESEASRAERSRSVSTARRASSRSAARRIRSIATAAWSRSASSRRSLLGGQRIAAAVARRDPDDADHARGSVRRGKNRRPPTRRASRLPVHPDVSRPGGPDGIEHRRVDPVRRRTARPHLEPARLVGQEKHRVQRQHGRDLLRRGPEQVVERHDVRDPAAEGVERLGGLGAPPRRERLGAHPGGEIAGDHRDNEEEEQRGDVRRVGDREGVEGRDEEEVVGEHARDGAGERGPQAVADRDRDDGRQEDEVDVLIRPAAGAGAPRPGRPRPRSGRPP